MKLDGMDRGRTGLDWIRWDRDGMGAGVGMGVGIGSCDWGGVGVWDGIGWLGGWRGVACGGGGDGTWLEWLCVAALLRVAWSKLPRRFGPASTRVTLTRSAKSGYLVASCGARKNGVTGVTYGARKQGGLAEGCAWLAPHLLLFLT